MEFIIKSAKKLGIAVDETDILLLERVHFAFLVFRQDFPELGSKHVENWID